MSLAPPPAGEFAALTSLSVANCLIDLEALLPLCPRLSVLVLDSCIRGADAIIHLPLLEALDLEGLYFHYIDIEAPELKKVRLQVHADEGFRVSFSAPMVEQMEWCILYDPIDAAFAPLWHLLTVRQLRVPGQLPCVDIDLHVDVCPSATCSTWLSFMNKLFCMC